MNETDSNTNYPVLQLQSQEKRVVPSGSLTQEEREQARQIADTVNFKDTNSVLLFGLQPQQKMNEFLDSLLSDAQVGQAGLAGDIALELSDSLDMMQIEKIKKEMTEGSWAYWWTRLPFLGDFFSQIHYFAERKQLLLDKLDTVVKKATSRRNELVENNVRLDQLYHETETYHQTMAMWIVAGEMALQRAEQEFQALRKTAEQSDDPTQAAELRDLEGQITAFDTRLLRMKTAYTSALAAGPQIRLTQEAGRIEMQQIVDSLLFDMPNLKQAVIRVAALYNIIHARKENEQRRQASRKIAGVGADLLDEAYTAAKQSQGNSLEDVLSLEDAANKLIDTIRKGKQIEQENKAKRREASEKLVEVKTRVTQALKEIKTDTAGQEQQEEN
ncbi:hypothetical protein GF373_09255 [bacterium]|nr:hypothetical protein [bacterium]